MHDHSARVADAQALVKAMIIHEREQGRLRTAEKSEILVAVAAVDDAICDLTNHASAVLKLQEEHARADVALLRQLVEKTKSDCENTLSGHSEALEKVKLDAKEEIDAICSKLGDTERQFQQFRASAIAEAENAREALASGIASYEAKLEILRDERVAERNAAAAAAEQLDAAWSARLDSAVADARACRRCFACEVELLEKRNVELRQANQRLEESAIGASVEWRYLAAEKDAAIAGLRGDIAGLRNLLQQALRGGVSVSNAEPWRALHLESRISHAQSLPAVPAYPGAPAPAEAVDDETRRRCTAPSRIVADGQTAEANETHVQPWRQSEKTWRDFKAWRDWNGHLQPVPSAAWAGHPQQSGQQPMKPQGDANTARSNSGGCGGKKDSPRVARVKAAAPRSASMVSAAHRRALRIAAAVEQPPHDCKSGADLRRRSCSRS